MVDNNIKKNPYPKVTSLTGIPPQSSHSPIILKQNTNHIYTWGFSKYGQTGIENCQYCLEPTLLNFPLSQEIISVHTGESNTAFITQDNSVYIFGKNTFGELGDDTNKLSYIPKLLSIKLELISIGGEHILGLTKDNNLYSWGLNVFGQLGLGHTENVSSPCLIEKFGFLTDQEGGIFLKETPRTVVNERVIEISCGAQHTMILTSNNVLYSCGFAKNSALGYFNTNSDQEPTESLILTKIVTKATSKKYSKISCGVNHSGCLLGTTDLLLWGKSELFEFDGIKRFNLSKRINSPGADAFSVTGTLIADTTQAIATNSYILTDCKIGENFIILLSSNGDLFSSGTNEFGQLGIVLNQRQGLFEPVKLSEKIRSVSVGFNFVCAVGFDGKVYAWGNNRYGQILDFEKDVCPLPKEVSALNKWSPISISCGGYHGAILSKTVNNIDKTRALNQQLYNYKKIPLNGPFNPDRFQQENQVLKNVTDILQQQLMIEEEIKEKEKIFLDLKKSVDEKMKAKYEATKRKITEKLDKKTQLSPSWDKVFDEEIKVGDLVFPDNDFLGTGAFGEVKKAYWRKTLVAVKFLKKSLEGQQDQVIPFIEEFNWLKNLRHPNILLYIGGCISGPEHFLVTEYCDNGNWFEFLHGNSSLKLDNKERLKYAWAIAKGVNYWHSFNPPIWHRDLKSLNILLDKNFEVKICDFGWARWRTPHMTKQRGTFQWMAPEVIIKDNYTEKADVYSFGIILWEFWSRDPPFKGVVAKDVAINVKKNKAYRPKIPNEVPREIAGWIEQCWDYEPMKRPKFLNIINFIEKYMAKV